MKASEYCIRVFDGTHDTPKPKDQGKLLITSKNIADGQLNLRDAYFISEEEYCQINKRSQVHQWDVLFSMIGTVGSVYLETNESIDYAIKNMGVFSCGDWKKAHWLYYYLQSPSFKSALKAQLSGAIQKFVPLQFLRDLEVPSLHENSEIIIHILSSLDRKIALNRKSNKLLESMAKQLYDYWFVQFDFPNAEGKPYKSSGGKMVYNETLKRDIPEGWEVGNLFEVSNLLTGGTPSKAVDDYWQGGTIPFFGPTDCDGSTFQFTTEYRITESGLSHSAAKIMNENCVIITARGSIGKYVITGIPMAMNQSCFAFEAKDGNYAHLYFLVGQLIQHLLVKGSGSTFKSIVGIDIENSILCLGEPNVRKAFERIVRPMFEKIKSNTQETLRLTSLRDYLLPLLMNGQIKVS